MDLVDGHSGDVADANVRRLQEGPYPRQLDGSRFTSFVSTQRRYNADVSCTRVGATTASGQEAYMSRRGCRLTLRLSVEHPPTDRQTLTTTVTSESSRDRSSTSTRTRWQTPQLHAGRTQPHQSSRTTSRMTARWASKEAHPPPTYTRASTGTMSWAPQRERPAQSHGT